VLAHEDRAAMRSQQIDPQKFLPLTPAMFHILVALADGDKHGYAIMKEAEQRSEGEVRLSAGTLYGIIKRLREEGMIEEMKRRSAFARGEERRRTYRLTRFGREVALAEAQRLEKILAMARSKNLLAGTGVA